MWRLLTLYILWPPLCVCERKNARLSLVYEGLIQPSSRDIFDGCPNAAELNPHLWLNASSSALWTRTHARTHTTDVPLSSPLSTGEGLSKRRGEFGAEWKEGEDGRREARREGTTVERGGTSIMSFHPTGWKLCGATDSRAGGKRRREKSALSLLTPPSLQHLSFSPPPPIWRREPQVWGFSSLLLLAAHTAFSLHWWL